MRVPIFLFSLREPSALASPTQRLSAVPVNGDQLEHLPEPVNIDISRAVAAWRSPLASSSSPVSSNTCVLAASLTRITSLT